MPFWPLRPVAGWYVCPHGEDDGCDCLKPAPGLAQAAARDLGCSITRAWIVGDKLSDAGMAPAFAGRGILVTTGHGAKAAAAARAAGIPVVADLNGAADVILAAHL